MNFLCLQSTLAAIVPCDFGMVGIPVFGWIRDAFFWIRRVSIAASALDMNFLLRLQRPAQRAKSLAMLAASLVGASLIGSSPVHAEANRVKFPEIETLVHYTTVTRGNVTEHIMTTPQAIAAIKQGRPAPAGTHFVLVDYRDGKVHRYFVMQKEAGWGADYDAKRRTGDWQFQWFWADRSLNLGENTARCQSCHDSRKDSDYLYTANRIAEFDKTPVE